MASLRRRWVRQSLVVCAALLMGLGTVVGVPTIEKAAASPSSFATQAKPATVWSFYITSSSTSAAYNLGCNQGNFDRQQMRDSAVVLDFGMQTSSGSYDFSNANLSNSQIQAIAEEFSHGYWYCTGSDTTTVLHLGIGTSNYTNGLVTYNAGVTWANNVKAVQSYNQSYTYASQVTAMGANDIEPSWHSYSATRSWVDGYSATTTLLYYNYGSADGCPSSSASNGSCNNGWNQYDVYYVSWGAPPAVPTPEIYNSTMAWQWQKISLYGAIYQGGRMNIWAPWDENAGDYTDSQAWNALWNDLNSDSRTAQNFWYAMEIHWQ